MIDDDGYRLWLRYELVSNADRRMEYLAAFTAVLSDAKLPSRTLHAAQDELIRGLAGLLGRSIPLVSEDPGSAAVIIGTPSNSAWIASQNLVSSQLGGEGFVIAHCLRAGVPCLVIAANEDVGVLYGAFALLRKLQTERALDAVAERTAPQLRLRMLDHWDNLDRTIERGYAGFSLWDWHKLPDYVDPRYRDYARANASLGINAAVLNNVNADSLVLSVPYLEKVAALADVFRPFGIRVYLSARFSAPIELGGLARADPLDPQVIEFWRLLVGRIYTLIPDFGGFLVKANSEGQPGPEEYGRSHADGANLLADALDPHGGIVIWRAFVYRAQADQDRAKQAYEEFQPLDGSFRSNAVLQIKNGPIDFQPREPFHPLFAAMPQTALVAEFQITQEYLGCATHLCYLGPLMAEVLQAETFAHGPGSTVARALAGALGARATTGMAGVANVGSERNWCGHPFAQANWFAFGRLAWDPELDPAEIAREWLGMTFSNDPAFQRPVGAMMAGSREAVVDYMTPLGLHHLFALDHHYGPAPWLAEGRVDWTSVYFHRADTFGLGFDRSFTGSNAVAQYRPPLCDRFGQLETCPENLWLWFHHVAWGERLQSGRTLWQELHARYFAGTRYAEQMAATWATLTAYVDRARHEHVSALLQIQIKEAKWWRDACLLYFGTFSGLPRPPDYDPPEQSLAEYQRVQHRYVPGIKDRAAK